MNQMKQELMFEGDFLHLQNNVIQLLVSRSAFIPNFSVTLLLVPIQTSLPVNLPAYADSLT